jgi:hypothetical protein
MTEKVKGDEIQGTCVRGQREGTYSLTLSPISPAPSYLDALIDRGSILRHKTDRWGDKNKQQIE